MPYDHLVLALGNVTKFFGLDGLAERACTMKSLGDAVHLRNRLIRLLEEADFECASAARGPLLTVIVAGGGFAVLRDEAPQSYAYRAVGQLAAIGRRAGVAQLFGMKFSGFPAWWMWRTIYLRKLPRLEKKVRVALDWTLDLLFSKDFVQYSTGRAPSASTAMHGAEQRTATLTLPMPRAYAEGTAQA